MKLSGDTKIHELIEAHAFLEEFLIGYNRKFEMLRNRMARATIGRVATLRTVAGIANIDLEPFLKAIAEEIEKRTGTRPETGLSPERPGHARRERIEALRGIIHELHDGGDLELAQQRFTEIMGDVEASEIAAMEEELIRDGLPVSEVQRLCDVHVGAFRHALDQHGQTETPPGHPVHTYMAANRVIARLADRLASLVTDIESGDGVDAKITQVLSVLDELGGVENHYQRKENELFSVLERHDVTGPSQVMWGIHDQIRERLKTVREAAKKGDAEAIVSEAPGLARDLVEMVYKEEKILFPMSLQTLNSEEWAEIRRGEDDLGYVLAKPAGPWPQDAAVLSPPTPAAEGLLALTTGELTLEQVNLMLAHLPVDLSFVDETDTVRFYSEGPDRIFPRSPAVIGRKVQNCHPPKSVHMVEEILAAFRSGEQSVAEFWIELADRFIHIRYFAIRDRTEAYRGCLEVSQDVTGIRGLKGQRRLLEWGSSRH